MALKHLRPHQHLFSPQVKQLNFDPSIIGPAVAPNYDCTSTVSYSLNQFTCSGSFCDLVYPVSSYNITWQAPSGWTQTSLTNNGSNVSFTPDANSSGSLIATIHIPGCSYTETRTFAITRAAQPPRFTTLTSEACDGSSSNISINPTCGAINYTYSIVGNSGVKFTSNNLQTLTTSNTTVNVTTSGGASVNSLKAVANYPNSISSTEATSTLTVNSGYPSIGINVGAGGFTNMEDCGDGANFKVLYNAADLNYSRYLYVTASEATSLGWTEVSNSTTPYWGWSTSNNGQTLNVSQKFANKYLSLKVMATNGCGSVNKIYTFGSGVCPIMPQSITLGGDDYLLAPNPAGDNVTISVNGASKNSKAVSFAQIQIYDGTGNLKKQIKYGSGTRHAQINIADLRPGTYYVEISDGKTAERKPLVVQR
jgi:hypothetical protein